MKNNHQTRNAHGQNLPDDFDYRGGFKWPAAAVAEPTVKTANLSTSGNCTGKAAF
jgi:hypothetical protein